MPAQRRLEAFGESKSLAGWLRDPRCKVGRQTLRERLDAGWSAERAIAESVAPTEGPDRSSAAPRKASGKSPVNLSRREVQVLEGIAEGLGAEQLAPRLGVTPRTVSEYRKDLYRKLGVHNAGHAVARGYELGFLRLAKR